MTNKQPNFDVAEANVKDLYISSNHHGESKDALEPVPAAWFLNEAVTQMNARAQLRDTAQGERTAGKIATVFNALTGHNLTEADAWTFLIVLKIVRSRNGKFSADDYTDLSAYSALLGEHESTSRG
jgi:hypothetical protein